MLKGLNIEDTKTYMSDLDPAKKEAPQDATQFTLGVVDSRVMGRLRDAATQFTGGPNGMITSVNSNEQTFQVVQFGLRGWTNFNDSAGRPIQFLTEKISIAGREYVVAHQDIVRRLPTSLLNELRDQIIELNEISQDTAKNSGT